MRSRTAISIIGLLVLFLSACGLAPRPNERPTVAVFSPSPGETVTKIIEMTPPPQSSGEADDGANPVDAVVQSATPTVTQAGSEDSATASPGTEGTEEPGEGALLHYDERAFDGYTLFNPQRSRTSYLIDIHGKVVHTWESDYPLPNSAYLLENGNLLRPVIAERNEVFGQTGGSGRVQELNWDGDLLWEFEYSSDQVRLHHDIEPLPGGNVLMIAWEYKSAEGAIAAGRNPDLLGEGGALWPDHVIEVDPATDEIVWEWHVWDHLIQDLYPDKDNYGVVADHPELLDINHSQGRVLTDMNHVNAIDYNLELSYHQKLWIGEK